MKRQELFRIAAILAGMAALFMVLAPYFRFERLIEHFGTALGYVHAHYVPALVGYFGLYVVIVVLSLPFALPMTLLGGALFGGAIGGATTLLAATCGATLIFVAARSLLHDYFVRRTEPWLGGIRREFQADAASYLLMLRLTPIFPFTVINLAAGLLGVRFRTYVWTSFFGMMPGTAAYSYIGAGLSGVLAAESARYVACRQMEGATCAVAFDPASLVSRDVGLGLAGLAVLVLISQFARRRLARSNPKSNESRHRAATE